MGVINLGLLVEKIKRKLEDSGFIKNTDYASASAAGVVKVGEGLEISSAGVLSSTATGGGLELLYTAPDTPVTPATEITLSDTISNYKFLIIVENTSDNTNVITMLLNVEVAPYKAVGMNYGASYLTHTFTIDGAKITDTTSPTNANLRWYKVYGLK